jgi:nitrite reductase/ring-hydroxylating ferredoxin subunit
MSELASIVVGPLDEIDNPGCREFSIGDGDWPFKGFVVRQGNEVVAYQNFCKHAGHPLNWKPDHFLTKDNSNIICSSHGAIYKIDSGECVAGPCVGMSLNAVECWIEDGSVKVRGPNGLR